MKPRSHSSQAFVLARKNYGEADRILILFSKDQGKIPVLAKGARRPKSRKRGHIEVFNLINYQSVAGRGFDILTEAEVVDDFKNVRKNLKKISLAYYFSEVVGKITHEGEQNLRVYNLLTEFFGDLKSAKRLKDLRLRFVVKLLTILGYWPAGREMKDPDFELEEVIERELYSPRVGKKVII